MASKTLPSILVGFVALLASLAAFLKEPVTRRLEIIGFYRPITSIENIHGEGLERIPDTILCEDIHYHEASGMIYGVSETNPDSRKNWFPPIGNFAKPNSIGQGRVFVLNPKTKEKTDLKLNNFPGPLLTHGIDIYSPSSSPEMVYIYAVNHLANPSHATFQQSSTNTPAAASQLELFRHIIGSDSAEHLRSFVHLLIRTPNDIFVINSHEFYVTNDHQYRYGHLRTVEDIGYEWTAWSDIVHVKSNSHSESDPTKDIDVNIALENVHNPNGLGHGKHEGEILLGRAAAGVMEIRRVHDNHSLDLLESIQLPMTIDNPSYFRDPYAEETGRDASGYVNTGLAHAKGFPDAEKHPSSVYFVGEKDREPKLIFQDNGDVMNTASTALIVAIDPKENAGKKEGWLFVTGFFSEGVIRTTIAL